MMIWLQGRGVAGSFDGRLGLSKPGDAPRMKVRKEEPSPSATTVCTASRNSCMSWFTTIAFRALWCMNKSVASGCTPHVDRLIASIVHGVTYLEE